MKLLHLSDLHLGKKLNGFSLHDDQLYILQQIISLARTERVEAVLIAGDIFDKSLPPSSAVNLFDEFITLWSDLGIPTFIISGNHDSAERLAFGNRLFATSNIYISPVYHGYLTPLTLEDEHGPVNFYLLPFLKPATVRPYLSAINEQLGLSEENALEITSYNDAVAAALAPVKAALRSQERNILLAHQFVTGSLRADSEEVIVGGLDNIEADLLADFDYVALGHLHTAQQAGYPHIRYCGTPLKYSVSEATNPKSVTLIELGPKGMLNITQQPLIPLHDLRKLKGSYEELTFRPNYEHTVTDDYLAITLTDEQDIPEAIQRLRVIYPNILQLTYDNQRTRINQKIEPLPLAQQQSPIELFANFYQLQNNMALDEAQLAELTTLIDELWEE